MKQTTLVGPAIAGIVGLLVVLLKPFNAIGASWRPGLPDLINGLVGLMLLILAAVWAIWVGKSKRR